MISSRAKPNVVRPQRAAKKAVPTPKPLDPLSPSVFRLPYPPSANRYWRTTARGGRVITYPSPEAKAYKASVAKIAAAIGLQPMMGDLELHLIVYRPIRKGDLSNRIKVLEDALQGFAFVDDSQIVCIVAYRRDDKDAPCVEVEVRKA